MEIWPSYYHSFHCIAAECQHNCCIGWEIDIDDDTLEIYRNQTGYLGEKLRRSIADDGCPHFILGHDERCPFLNGDNLCELIIHGGDDLLCQICRDHPRFYNEICDITEKGIGLSCEAAASLILSNTEKVTLMTDGQLPNDDFYTARGTIFSLLQDRTRPLTQRIDDILAFADTASPIGQTDWIQFYKSLERLDNQWSVALDGADHICADLPKEMELPCEQLLHYFIYRHLGGCLEDFLFAPRLQFALLSCYVIVGIAKTADRLADVARMYSSEIEYSDQNVDAILQKLQEINNQR